MSKIKSVSQFEDNIWGEATPIGADASNIDVEMSDSSIKDLQTVLGDIPSAAAPIQSQINTKVTASGGNIGNTTVSSGIQNFDSSSSETSTELLDTSVRVTNATEVTSSMWTKFNRFRKRVDNKFKDVFLSSVEDVASPSLTKTYSQSALNDYFANVVGYATAADLPDASSTIASQLSTLNNNSNFLMSRMTKNNNTFTLNNALHLYAEEGVSISNNSNSPTAIRWTQDSSSSFFYAYAAGGIKNLLSDYYITYLITFHICFNNTGTLGDYSIGSSLKQHLASGGDYVNYKYLGFTPSATSQYCLFSETVYAAVPPGGYLALFSYNQTSGRTIKTASSSWAVIIPLGLYP